MNDPYAHLRATGVRIVHFLHIGKTAGTEIGRYLAHIGPRLHRIAVAHRTHTVRLRHLPLTDDYFFSIREPVARFRSGFYSRKRKGMPRTYVEWTAHEARAFADFEHANDLAEALFEQGEVGCRAFAAMKSISHTSMNQVDWFDARGHFLDIRPPLAILRQECFDEDMRALQHRLGLRPTVVLPKDPVQSHMFDYRDVPALSPKAVDKLERWYAQDVQFYRTCTEWITSTAQRGADLSQVCAGGR